jgi:hypothetical protein
MCACWLNPCDLPRVDPGWLVSAGNIFSGKAGKYGKTAESGDMSVNPVFVFNVKGE